MRVHLDWDERYPDPAVSERQRYFTTEVEIAESDWADWLRVKQEYDAWCAKWEKIEKQTVRGNERQAKDGS